RDTVRAAALQEAAPSAVLEGLNRAVLDSNADERFCTISLAVVDAEARPVRATLSVGGTPLPYLLRAPGTFEPVGRRGTAIGLLTDVTLADSEVTLEPGDALVFYTDGFTEARSPEGAFAPGLLEASVGACAGLRADAIADVIERTILEFEGGVPRDDMALLVLRVTP